MNSLYLHTRADYCKLNLSKVGSVNSCFYNYLPKVIFDIREVMFSSLSPTLVRYDELEDKLVFDNKGELNEHFCAVVSIIQSNALKFIDDLLSKYSKYSNAIIYPKDNASLPFETYLLYSNHFDKKMFEDFVFEDDIGIGYHSLVDPWEGMCRRHGVENADNKKQSFKRRIANKLFPKGTRRRKFAKKVYLCLKKIKNKIFHRKK